MSVPANGAISGQPVSLLAVVASVSSRAKQSEAVHAYWRLVEAVAEYRYCHDREARLGRLKPAEDETAELQTAQAIAAANLREAELRATTAQLDLAALLALARGAPLPLPADRPLVEPYRTRFQELFAGQNAPEQARMLDQLLPLRNRAVEGHAAALLAAEDALDAAVELQAGGKGRLAAVIQAMETEGRQRKAFISAVCRYNHDIADYALTVVPSQTAPELLVTTLTRDRPAGRFGTAPTSAGAAVPAGYQEPIVAPRGPVVANPRWPTRAPRPAGADGATADVVPKDRGGAAPGPSDVPAGSPPAKVLDAPRLAPPQESVIPPVPEKAGGAEPAGRDGTPPPGPANHSARKPVTDDVGAPTYSRLENMAAAERAIQLAAGLHADRNHADISGKALSFVDCLRSAGADSRLGAIEAYWTARQAIAQRQALAEEARWLESLERILATRELPSPTGLLALRAARLAVDARCRDSDAEVLAARFRLTGTAGRSAEAELPLPVSIPRAGRFQFSSSPADDWRQRRLEAAIGRWELVLADRGSAVIRADAARAAAASDLLGGRGSIERALGAAEVRSTEASAFLQGLTEYNRTIAEYAMGGDPTGSDPQKIAEALSAGM